MGAIRSPLGHPRPAMAAGDAGDVPGVSRSGINVLDKGGEGCYNSSVNSVCV